MPSTTPDLRTVTGGCSSFRAGGGERSVPVAATPASVNVDGARAGRRCGGTSAVLARSDFGHASSNDAGGASLGSGAGSGAAGGAGRRSGADGSAVRASARSRSFRDDEENKRLRRGLTAGAASTGSEPREAASSCQGGADGAPGSPLPAFFGAGWSRLNKKP